MTDSSLGSPALTPVSFLRRSAHVFARRTAVIDGGRELTYSELWRRCCRQAGLLRRFGVGEGDAVGVLAPNSLLMLESHYGAPGNGSVLVTLNQRLSVTELAYVAQHSRMRVLLAHPTLAELATAVAELSPDLTVVIADDDYERGLENAPEVQLRVLDETQLISLNYTSGTTGRPKGVMYQHRGAYLQSLAMVAHFGLNSESTYLWTLPMFHCNGWCFTWAVTAAGGTHVCIPRPDPEVVWASLRNDDVTHMCGAPTVLTNLLAQSPAPDDALERRVVAAVGGAPPSPALLAACDEAGLDIVHLYGLTETMGPAVICDWQDSWRELDLADRARIQARQGNANLVSEGVRVVSDDGNEVTHDGSTVGEVLIRGSNVMLGYYRDESATAEALVDGWLRTGDLGVVHADGYLEIKDRAKDLIVSGGENIASVEVENALVSHPAVLEAAVVGAPDARWGERPVAYVTVRRGAQVSEEELRAHVRTIIAGFKVPDRVFFADDLPKTASGKLRKADLRAQHGDTIGVASE